MTTNTHHRSELSWFLKPQSPVMTAAIWSMAKAAGGLQNLCGNRCSTGFGILMYHRIAENTRGVSTPTLNVTPTQFRRQLSGLLSRGFECWPLPKLVAAYLDARPIPANAFAITFDDGYENNYVHAWPILRELKLSGTIFIATQYLDSNERFPFDAWSDAGSKRALPSAWRPLTTDQCQEMLDSGVIELGAHTHSHRRFIGRKSAFTEDMRLCLDVLRDRFGIVRPTFAFPYGEFNADLVDAARKLELSCAVTARQRRVMLDDDLYQWGRQYAGQTDTSATLAAKLSGWHSALLSTAKFLTRNSRRKRRAADRIPQELARRGTNVGATLTRTPQQSQPCK